MFEIIQSNIADLAEKLTPYAPYFLALFFIHGIIVNSKLRYPMSSEPLWTDNVKRVTIQTGIGTVVLGALVGFFLQSIFRSVYSLLLIPLSILIIPILLMSSYIFGLYLIHERNKRIYK